MKFKQYLNEKTYNIDADVDMIYKKYFKDILTLFKKGKIDEFLKKLKSLKGYEDYQFGFFKSSILKSKQIKQATEINPVNIQVGIFKEGSFYKPLTQLLSMSLNYNALTVLLNRNIDDIKKEKWYDRWENEFTEASIKGTIYHELSHWLNDTFHNKNITKRLEKVQQSHIPIKGYLNLTDFELDAQIHALKQLKRNHRKDWDDLSWKEISMLKPSFIVVFNQLKSTSKKDREDFRKRMFKRLNREKLLGNKMKTTFMEYINEI